jgi:hypothetical protein
MTGSWRPDRRRLALHRPLRERMRLERAVRVLAVLERAVPERAVPERVGSAFSWVRSAAKPGPMISGTC